MLILERDVNEEVLIGDNVRIVVTKIRGGKVWLGFDAPKGVPIIRPDAKCQEPRVDRVKQAIADGVPLHDIEGMLDHEENTE